MKMKMGLPPRAKWRRVRGGVKKCDGKEEEKKRRGRNNKKENQGGRGHCLRVSEGVTNSTPNTNTQGVRMPSAGGLGLDFFQNCISLG